MQSLGNYKLKTEMIRIAFSWAYIMMLKLKLQYFGHLMQRTDLLKRPWCWEILKAGGKGDDRRWDGWMAPPTQWTWIWVNSRCWWCTGRPSVLQSMGLQSQTRLGKWTELRNYTGAMFPFHSVCFLPGQILVCSTSIPIQINQVNVF